LRKSLANLELLLCSYATYEICKVDLQSTAKVETWKPIQNRIHRSKKIETWHIHGSALFESRNANSLLKNPYGNDKN